jgi:hypothetical protein
MKLGLLSFGSAAGIGYSSGNVTMPIPAPERLLKTSDLHISLVRHSYIAVDATAAEPYDEN